MRTTHALLAYLASTGRRTDQEVAIAGIAFIVGGALLFFGQPLRRVRRRMDGGEENLRSESLAPVPEGPADHRDLEGQAQQ